MNKGMIFAIVGILLLLLVGGGLLFWFLIWDSEPEEVEEPNDETEERQEELPPEPEPMDPPAQIEAERLYTEDTHSITGTIDVPTACHYVDLEATTEEAETEEIVSLHFNSSVETGDRVCEPVLTTRSFEIEVKASEKIDFEAFFDGTPVDLIFREDNLVVEEDDDDQEEIPEDVFIKD